MPGDKNSGITLSRTIPPTLPPEYLSRRRLFSLIDNETGGTTFVIAPAGFGKTTAVAEWAHHQSRSVIWLTVANGDTTNEMSAMLIAATRRVIPGFAPWFETDQPIRATEVVRRWGNELIQSGKEFIFVLDNLRSEENEDVDIAIRLIEQFPRNIHFVAIRNNEIPGIYGVCSSRGPIKVLTTNELRFQEFEIEQYATNLGVPITEENRKLFNAGSGWPAATALLIAHIQAHGKPSEIENIMSSNVEPLRALVMIVLRGLDSEIIDICQRLSIRETFTDEQAKVILGELFSIDLISAIAHKGEIFAPLRAPQGGYVFSPMVRQVLQEQLRNRGNLATEMHQNMLEYFERIGQPSLAIFHAFQSGNQEKIAELFPSAARAHQAQGKGGELLRWSVFAGYSEDDGELKALTVAITGHLADLNILTAISELTKLKVLAPSSNAPEFFLQFADAAMMYVDLSLGKFESVEELFKVTKVGTEDCYLGVDDQINILRILATKRYIWNQVDGVEEVYHLAQELIKQTSLYTSHAFIHTIHAMYLHQRGEYRKAFEIANLAILEFQRYRFVGNHGPLDVMYVAARCLLEFSRTQEALAQLEKLREISYQWKQWHWYFVSDNHFMQHLSYSGNQREALDRVKKAREFLATFETENQLSNFIDLAEMNIRRTLRDFDRLEVLVNRAPNIRDTQQYRMALDEYRGRKSVYEDAKNLPAKYPRDLIWKHLTEASLNIDSEQIALPAMQKAMKIGSDVGAKETFLRQRDEMGNLIIRIANDFPTVYNEELATAMAERMNERGKIMTAGHQALTKRELEILRQLSTGRTLTVIASELHISQNTMKTHLKNLYKKLEADGRNDAVEKAKALFLL
jgi:ATP/maltotriose-dependent transcriptional regulator MalT